MAYNTHGYSQTGIFARANIDAHRWMIWEASCSCRQSSFDLTRTGNNLQFGSDPNADLERNRSSFADQSSLKTTGGRLRFFLCCCFLPARFMLVGGSCSWRELNDDTFFFFSRPGLCHWPIESSALGDGGRELALPEDTEDEAVILPRDFKPTELDAPPDGIIGGLLLLSILFSDSISCAALDSALSLLIEALATSSSMSGGRIAPWPLVDGLTASKSRSR